MAVKETVNINKDTQAAGWLFEMRLKTGAREKSGLSRKSFDAFIPDGEEL